MSNDYPYSDGNLLEERNTYFYSKFKGEEFFDSWRDKRANVLAECFELEGTRSEAKKYDILENDGVISTEFLLSSLYAHLEEDELKIEGSNLHWLPILIQRFEVSKRVHESYSSSAPFRPEKGTSFRDLNLYLLYAEVMELSWTKIGSLPALNVFLKLMDTLCAYVGKIEKTERFRLRKLILREEEIVKEVGLTQGVRI